MQVVVAVEVEITLELLELVVQAEEETVEVEQPQQQLHRLDLQDQQTLVAVAEGLETSLAVVLEDLG
jgi:hypothetical protein